jgi:RNA polymerase sigma-70 factor (ECF subfamily)
MLGRILRISTSKAPGPASRPAAPDPVGLAEPPLAPAELARFRELMLPHLDAAYAYARFLCRDPTLAEDLTHDAFLRACRGFRGYRGGEARAWLFAIVRSGFLSWRRAPARRETADDAMLAEQPADSDTPEAAVMRRSETEQLRGAIDALPEPFRETLVLRELNELSYREVAEVTGAPIGTVMSRLARARQLLLAAFREEDRR